MPIDWGSQDIDCPLIVIVPKFRSRKRAPMLPLFGEGGSAFLGAPSGSAARAMHFGVLAIVLMVVSLLLLKKLRGARELDYSAPVRIFLRETENRYRFIGPAELWYSIPLLAVLAVTGGLCVVDACIPHLFKESQIEPLLAAYGLFFAAVCALGYYFTYKDWKRGRGRILEDVRRMRHALESQPD